jgi:2Fe-2S ferredoxin
VRCTFIKPDGKRVTVPGRVGWSLLKTAKHHDVGLEGWESSAAWLEDFGDGPATAADHVVVANEWVDKLAPMFPEEANMLGTVPHATSTSRLAAVITLSKELDGITVYIPPENLSFKTYNA